MAYIKQLVSQGDTSPKLKILNQLLIKIPISSLKYLFESKTFQLIKYHEHNQG